jgi:phosphatidylserine decarboxylase
MFPIAPEGRIFVLGSAWVTVLTLLFGYTLAGIVLLSASMVLLLLFRRWTARVPPTEAGILAPVDGSVESIAEELDPLTGVPAWVVCIRQRWFGEGHVLAPADGVLEKRLGAAAAADERVDSRWVGNLEFRFASDDRCSYALMVDVRGWPRFVRMPLITGSRHPRAGRLGFVGFATRVRLWLPRDVVLRCAEGDRVLAGVSVLASEEPRAGAGS